MRPDGNPFLSHYRESRSFPSIAISRRRLGEVCHIAIELYAVEWNHDHFTAVIVVRQFLIFGHIKDRECKVSDMAILDRKSTRLNSSHLGISYAVFCLKKK